MTTALPRRATPELEYLQVLPLDKALSLGSIRRGTIDAGRAIDAEIERDIGSARLAPGAARRQPSKRIDQRWLRQRRFGVAEFQQQPEEPQGGT